MVHEIAVEEAGKQISVELVKPRRTKASRVDKEAFLHGIILISSVSCGRAGYPIVTEQVIV